MFSEDTFNILDRSTYSGANSDLNDVIEHLRSGITKLEGGVSIDKTIFKMNSFFFQNELFRFIQDKAREV